MTELSARFFAALFLCVLGLALPQDSDAGSLEDDGKYPETQNLVGQLLLVEWNTAWSTAIAYIDPYISGAITLLGAVNSSRDAEAASSATAALGLYELLYLGGAGYGRIENAKKAFLAGNIIAVPVFSYYFIRNKYVVVSFSDQFQHNAGSITLTYIF